VILVPILLCLAACILCASLAEAIHGLDPETLAVPDDFEDEAETAPIAQVTGRFRAAETHLWAGAVAALGGAGFLTAPLVEGLGASVLLVLAAAPVGVTCGLVIPDRLVRGREAALLGRTTHIVLALSALLRPIAAVQIWVAALLEAMLGSNGGGGAWSRPRGHAEAMVAPATPAGALETVLEFAHATLDEVMTPRAEMVVVEAGSDVAAIARLVGTTRHARYPVYRGNLDETIGSIGIRDLLGVEDGKQPLAPLVRPLPVVPESKGCRELAVEMQQSGQLMALVIDEFGAVSGLVTPFDLLAELVGEIAEEGEPTPDEFERVDSQTWSLNPFLRVDRVNELTGLGLPDGDYQTLAGFILSELGRIPAPRERLRWGDAEIEITAASRRRIEGVRVRVGKQR
jgi:CBS domain containing-hemolysin-like protein